jgi:hypothetical protein
MNGKSNIKALISRQKQSDTDSASRHCSSDVTSYRNPDRNQFHSNTFNDTCFTLKRFDFITAFFKGKVPLVLLNANDREKALTIKQNALQIVEQLKVNIFGKK